LDYRTLHLKTVQELRALAKTYGIKVPAGLNKSRLVELVLEAEQAQPPVAAKVRKPHVRREQTEAQGAPSAEPAREPEDTVLREMPAIQSAADTWLEPEPPKAQEEAAQPVSAPPLRRNPPRPPRSSAGPPAQGEAEPPRLCGCRRAVAPAVEAPDQVTTMPEAVAPAPEQPVIEAEQPQRPRRARKPPKADKRPR
jgi:hypothetical protein